MNSARPSIRVAVIGAGPGGLTAASLLARQGFQVDVFERLSRVGGRNGWFKTPEYTFDIGPTFFMMPFLLEEIFRECGRNLEDYVQLTDLDPLYSLSYPDGSVYHPSRHPEKAKASLRGIVPSDADAFDRYMSYHERKMDAIMPCLSIPYDRPWHMLRPKLLKAAPLLGWPRSLWRELGRFYRDDRIKLGFTFQSKYLGMSPFTCPALFSILSFTEYKWGIYHVRGGLNSLSLAQEKLAREMGARIHLNTDVSQVMVGKGRATGLRFADGRTEPFDEIVMNADFAWGMKNLFPDTLRRRYTDRRLASKKYSCSTFMLYLGLDTRYDHLEHHNVFIAPDYRANLRSIETGGPLSENISFYVQNASKTDPTLAPPNHSTIYVLVPTSNLRVGSVDWTQHKTRFRDLIVKLLEER
ncbi:MAG TPA: phytoene desaturase family protein, partial [Elusimicrobiota bacterium]|nr:phytoene desaturase family protein [Elusimicrobiota bacterium]